MKKGIIYSLIAGCIALLSACGAKLQAYNFSEEYATTLHYEGTDDKKNTGEEEVTEDDLLVGLPARSFYGGDLKRGGIWWAGKGITLEKGDVFIFEITQIGPDSTPQGATNPAIDSPLNPFGATFPPLDFIKEPVAIKISARYEPLDTTAASANDTTRTFLYLQADDASGYQTNANRPAHQIHRSAEFKEYYFDMRNIYNQITPNKHKVNGAMINSIKFFVNPGQTGYTGRIYIKEIKVVPAQQN